MKVWIVNQYKEEKKDDKFEFQGVFDTKEKAISACLDWSYGMGPAIMNEEISRETLDCWEGYFYPIARTLEA